MAPGVNFPPHCAQNATCFIFAPHSGQNFTLFASGASHSGQVALIPSRQSCSDNRLSSSAICAWAQTSSTDLLACAAADNLTYVAEGSSCGSGTAGTYVRITVDPHFSPILPMEGLGVAPAVAIVRIE